MYIVIVIGSSNQEVFKLTVEARDPRTALERAALLAREAVQPDIDEESIK